MAFEIIVRQEGAKPAASVNLPVENDGVRLLDLQRALCRAFKKPFPKTMASLTVLYFLVSSVIVVIVCGTWLSSCVSVSAARSTTS